MVRALHRAAVFTAITNSPPNLAHHVELGRTTLTPDDSTRNCYVTGLLHAVRLAVPGDSNDHRSRTRGVASDHSDRNRVVRTVRTLRHRDADVVSLSDQLLVDYRVLGLGVVEELDG